jgi:hypothetical protein
MPQHLTGKRQAIHTWPQQANFLPIKKDNIGDRYTSNHRLYILALLKVGAAGTMRVS